MPNRANGPRLGRPTNPVTADSCPADPDQKQSRPKPRMRVPAEERVNLVKVFSATKARDRDELGDRITGWVRARPGVKVINTVVHLSSDRQFHCLSIVLFCRE